MKHVTGTMWFYAANLLVHGLNYLFHVLTARGLTIDEYGLLGTSLALFMLGAAGSVALQNHCAKHAPKYNIRQLTHAMLGASAVVLIIGSVLFKSPIESLLIISIPLNWCIGALRGQAQYNGKMDTLGHLMLTETIAKVVLWISLSSFGLLGAMIAITGSMLFPIAIWFPKKSITETKSFWSIRRTLGGLTYQVLTLGIFLTLDMILIQTLYPREAGGYSAIIKLSQVLFYVSGMVTQVAYAQMIRKENVRWAWLTVSGFSGVALIGSLLLGPWVVTLLFGETYTQWAFLLPYAVISMALLSFAGLKLHSIWANGYTLRSWLPISATGFFLACAGILALTSNNTSVGVILAQAAGAAAMFCAMSWLPFATKPATPEGLSH